MPVEGAIADAARSHLPVTWDALQLDSKRFGDVLLQGRIDLVKEIMFGTVIAVTDEPNFPLRVIDYAGKLVALELIPPGIDFWMNESSMMTTTGTNEQVAFVDRADKLRQLEERLAWQVRKDEAAVFALLGRPRPSSTLPRPDISTPVTDVLLTPDPRGFPAPFRQGTGAQRLT